MVLGRSWKIKLFSCPLPLTYRLHMVYLHYEQHTENRERAGDSKGKGDYSLKVWYGRGWERGLLESIKRRGNHGIIRGTHG